MFPPFVLTQSVSDTFSSQRTDRQIGSNNPFPEVSDARFGQLPSAAPWPRKKADLQQRESSFDQARVPLKEALVSSRQAVAGVHVQHQESAGLHLGGGLAAGFWLEAGTVNDTGAGSGPGGSIGFHRRSTVSFSGPFGEIRLAAG